MVAAHVVTGGGRGVGRAIVEHLAAAGDAVVIIEADADAATWTTEHPAVDRLAVVVANAVALGSITAAR